MQSCHYEEHITYYVQYLKDIMKVIWKHCTDYELVQPSVLLRLGIRALHCWESIEYFSPIV